MLCPLHDSDGRPRTLATIEFDDFEQLTEIQEGYAVEYKSTWDDAVRKKIPKIFTSFANANGGWLFVGINNDGAFSGIARTRSDFDQTIAQIVRNHVTPILRFDARYVAAPDSNDGVLVVEIPEGIEPPYVADGAVYIRVSSSSERFATKAGSYALIDLHRKARSNRKEIENFCHRTAYFPPTWTDYSGSECHLPIIDIYLKHLHPSHRTFLPYRDLDEAEAIMLGGLVENGYSDYVCHRAHDSLLFRSSRGNHLDDVGPLIELFFDGSCKVSIPLVLLQSNQREAAIERLQSLRPVRNDKLIEVIDGLSSQYPVITFCKIVERYLAAKDRRLSDYVIRFEFENMQGAILEFQTDSYADYVRKYGFPYFGTIDGSSSLIFPEFCLNSAQEIPLYLEAWTRFLDSFGLPGSTADLEKREELMNILGIDEPNEEDE